MKSTYDKIWESAMRSIQIRMMSRADLKRKLSQKFPGEDGYILKVLDEMGRVELLNDKRYTEQLLNHLIQKPIGRFKIMNEMRKRGLDLDLAESLLMDIGYNEEDACEKALREKASKGDSRVKPGADPRVKPEDDKRGSEADKRKKKQKLMNFLRGRGFRDNIIYKTLNAITL